MFAWPPDGRIFAWPQRWLAGCCCEERPASSDSRDDFESAAVGLFPEGCVSYDPQGHNVTYASDVDGRWEYFCNFVENSKGVRFRIDLDNAKRRCLRELEVQLEEGWHFVYGGDACTSGPGTLRFLESMVRLKKRWPTRVHLLLGYKDLDMSRWTCDFDEDFEFRREELALLAGVDVEQVSDEEVTKSCEDCLKPGGWTWEYLQLAQLGILLGDTLFIHGEILSGGISVEDIRQSPSHKELVELGMVPNDSEHYEDMQEWIMRLNSWVRNRVRQWDLCPSWVTPADFGGKSRYNL